MNSNDAIDQGFIPYPSTFPAIQFTCPEYPGEELTRPCECDDCMGACNEGQPPCGECWACEAKADDDKWWAVNRADVLQI